MRVGRLLLFFALSTCSLFSATAFAQTSETGLPPFGSFHGSDFELVSLKNGNLHVEIPIVSLPQRAAPNAGFRFVYDMPTWEVNKSNPTPTTTQWTVAPVSGELVYWNVFSDPAGPVSTKHDVIQKTCSWFDQQLGITFYRQYNVHVNYVMTDRHGTKHFFDLRHVDEPSDGCADSNPTNIDTGVALDGTGYTTDITSNRNSPMYQLADDIGQFNGNLGNELSTGGTTTIQNDANGVKLYEIWTVKDSNGNLQQFRVDYGPVVDQTSFCPVLFPSPPSGTSCVDAGTGTLNLPQKLTLPTGKFYQFTWSTDGNADLLRIDLPTGGYIAYAYTTQTWLPPFQHPITQYKARRRVVSRTVSDGASPQTWTYSGGVVHDPLGNEQVHMFGIPTGGSDTEATYEVQVDFYQGTAASGTLLRTIKKDYLAETDIGLPDGVDHGTINPRLIRTTTILADGTQTKTETDYEMFTLSTGGTFTRLNPIERREYAYGAGAPGPLLRRTDYTYLHTGNQNYLSRNIVHRVLATTVYDGNNIQVAQTVNEYDNYLHPGQLMLASNAIQHDPAYSTSFIYRGNVTAVSRWRNTDGAMLTTTNQYDDAGNLLSTIDPLGHKTSFDYTDYWGNTACAPTGQAKVFATTITNALNQFIMKSFNSCTATLASSTDLNSKTTTYSYDLIKRLASVTLPDGGHIANTYDDTQLLVTSSNLLTSAGASVFNRQHYDQLGRVVQAELCEDGASACATSIKTDTTFDGVGQTSTVSNPHRTASDPGPTNGITTTLYDATGRTLKVIPPDGSVSGDNVTFVYSGNCTTVTDQAGKSRKSCSDSLGRLTQVFEDPTGLNYETDYTYDTIDNLLSVSQKGGSTDSTQWRGRAFTYNSLSQFLSASNPESGKISYTYDAAGNPLTKTSPAPNQTNSTGTPGMGSVTINGVQNCRAGCDTGTVSITVNGFTKSTSYGQTSTSTTIATSLASLLNTPSSPVTATSSGRVVNLTSKATGSASNYPLSASSHSSVLPDPFFTASPSGSTLTGGTDPPTVTLTFCYDALNRLTAKGYTLQTCTNGAMPSPAVTYSYDQGAASANPIGRRTGMTDAGGSETWTYDPVGRVATDQRTTTGVTKTTSYTYNLDGSLATLTYPSGRTITYAPNAAGRTVSAVDSIGPINYATNATYAPQGALASVQNGGSLYSTFIFNKRLQPCWLYATTSSVGAPTNCTQIGVANAAMLDYQYDFGLGVADNGNVNGITNRRDPTRSQLFMYDGLNRLATAQTQTTGVTIPNPNCWGLTFGYDPWGNQLSSSTTGPAGCSEPLPTNFAVTASNRISTNTVAGQITNYCYDAAGNLISITAPSTACPTTGPFQYTYDAENHMTSTAGVTYTYDGEGKRIQKSTGTIYWYGMGSDALDETDLTGSITNAAFKEYVFFGGKRIARRDSTNAVNYYFADHLGTARVVTNATGSTILDDSDFYPFGGERPITSSSGNTYKFTGKERDSESGLDAFDARYYSSSMGRFMTPDWSARPVTVPYATFRDPQTLNLYTYVENAPLNRIDADGHLCGVLAGAQTACAEKETAQAAAEKPQNTTTITNANFTVDVTNTQTTVTTMKDATTLTNTTTTTATFSNAPGEEGTFQGATRTTVTQSLARVETMFGPDITHIEATTTTTQLSQKEANSALGSAFVKAQGEAANPRRDAYFIRAVARDARAHPFNYALHAAGLALPFTGVPTAAEGIITALEALKTAYDLQKEAHNP